MIDRRQHHIVSIATFVGDAEMLAVQIEDRAFRQAVEGAGHLPPGGDVDDRELTPLRRPEPA
jgi:hypothetical protein